MKPKFEIGQTVKFINDKDSEAGEIVDITWNATDGFSYKFKSRALDPEKIEVIHGFKTCKEDELVKVKVEAPAQEEKTDE